MVHTDANAKGPRPQFLDRTMLRWPASEQIIGGLWVGVFRGDAVPGLERVEAALTLIKRFDPLRYRRLLHDLQRVWITLLPGSLALFDEALWACELDDRFVLDAAVPVEQIAAAIVHEATHARLARRGVGYAESVRHRVEAICLRREMAFASRLPNGEAIQEQADRMLPLCDSAEYWTNAAFAARHRTEMKEAFRHLGMPDILITILDVTYAGRIAARKFTRGVLELAVSLGRARPIL